MILVDRSVASPVYFVLGPQDRDFATVEGVLDVQSLTLSSGQFHLVLQPLDGRLAEGVPLDIPGAGNLGDVRPHGLLTEDSRIFLHGAPRVATFLHRPSLGSFLGLHPVIPVPVDVFQGDAVLGLQESVT